MPQIPIHIREQIRSASDIVEVIGAYVPLRRAGASFVALCPFHREKTPSFHVSPARQAFHCFGCHKGGDVFRFVQDYESISFFEAAKRLAERAGIRIELEENPGQQERRELRDQLLDLHERITQRWQQVLQTDAAGQTGRDYLAARGVSQDAVRIFRLGMAPEAWDDTVRWATAKGVELRVLEQAGLILPRDAADPSRGYYDRFRGRLMFPIHDEQGRVVGFSGRVLKGDENTAKYVNSPETPIFTKGRILYGLDKTKRAILDAGSAIICEGQLDLIACFMAGVGNVVAPQGTALTSDHLRTLRRYAQEAVLCFDSDNAGRRAAARVLDDLLASGLALRVIGIPPPHDPDSYVRAHGAEAFRQLVSGAREFFEFYLEFLCSQNDMATDRGRWAVLDGMAAALGQAGNEVLFDRYAQRTAMVLAASGKLALSPDAVRAEFRRRRRSPSRGGPPHAPAVEPGPAIEKLATPVPAEFWLLKLLLLHDEFAGWLALHLDPSWIRHEVARELVSRIIRSHRDQAWHGAAAFLGDVEDAQARGLASEAMADTRTIPNPEQQLTDTVTRLRNAWIEQEIATLSVRVDQPGLADAERVSMLKRLQELRHEKRSPLVAHPGSDGLADSQG